MNPLRFDTLDKLLSYIEEDQNNRSLSYCRFPIRFIFLNNFEELRMLTRGLSERGVNIIDLTEFFPFTESSEGWMSINNILNLLNNLSSEKSYLVLSISEIARFYLDQEFTALFSGLTEIENTGTRDYGRRIYVPLLGIWNRFERCFLTQYARLSEWNPVWEIEGNIKKISIFFSNFEISTSKFLVINTSKGFLNLWKREILPEVIICTSKTLYHYSRNTISDELFEIKRIENFKDYITQLIGIKIPIPYDEKDLPFWQELGREIEKRKVNDFNSLVEDYFNVKRISEMSLLSFWYKAGNIFGRWLLKWYTLNNPEWQESYIYQVFSSLKGYEESEFTNLLWLKIFSLDKPEKFSVERRRYIRELYRDKIIPKSIEDSLKEKIEGLPEEKVINYLTGVSPIEKSWIIENVGIIDDLYDIYPELYLYMRDIEIGDINEGNSWIREYFKEYRHSKISNTVSKTLKSLLEEKNSNKESFYRWYYSFKNSKGLINENNQYKMVWIDGLGVEFASLLASILEEKGYGVSVYIARAELPSITEYNRFTDADYIQDLDKFIHTKISYTYPDDLVKEINIIKDIADYVCGLGDNILILSDHGFTAFANAKFDNNKIYDFESVGHEGRYASIRDDSTMFSEDEDFFLHQLEDEGGHKKYLIALKYKSLSNTPKREVHGGATPEEVLVPVIYATKMEREEISYEIEVINREISVREPVIKFRIRPESKYMPLVYLNDKKLEMTYDNTEGLYVLNLRGFKAGTYKFIVKIGGQKEEVNITIKGGMKEMDII